MARRWRIGSWLADAAAIAAVWAGALVAENVALGFLWRDQFSGIWEIALGRRAVVPLAIVGIAPLALVVAAMEWVTEVAPGRRWARRVLGSAGGIAAAALAVGVSQGRHFASSWGGKRVLFVAVLSLVGAWAGAAVLPRVARLRRRPLALAGLGLVTGIAAWTADAFVLPRLYPAFHWALFAATLLGVALVGLAARSRRMRVTGVEKTAAGVVGLAAFVCLATIQGDLRALDRAANVRRVLVEHAPLLGRVVAAATPWLPSEAEADSGAAAAHAEQAPGEVARSLDWTDRDVLLLTVDALRADHVSAYGYGRPTTPNIDALAREGATFSAAYCPTPHTSYSITSMMTGKYLRPLLALGMGEDSETWARYLRRYGWRTAAFYPPAVFFIDEARFGRFEEDKLGFEYAKVEFADPALREAQVAAYLDGAPADRSLFLWVHFFEPHEPYVVHPEHRFTGGPSADVDAYDSEVATADDGIGRIVRLVRARRPAAKAPVVIVTADHGEEFGEHGGRYHGTTVYEEQVRVPLVVLGPGVRPGARPSAVVQTIDLLPTLLSAEGIPRPARLRGRDLGALVGRDASTDPGLAFAETDGYALLASGPDRLICARRAAACELFRPGEDPLERRDFGPASAARFSELRGLLKVTEREHGRYEASAGPVWPEALRRGLQGEADAAVDVASLLDDADVTIRREAAEVSASLHVPTVAAAVRRALARDEDDEVRRWSALALAGMGEPVPPLASALLHDPARAWRRAAALALGSRGDPRACDELTAWWGEVRPAPSAASPDGEPPRLALDLQRTEELLAATARARCRGAVPDLITALEDVRARPYVADALGALGDDRARAPLLRLLAEEPYVTTRPHEARALLGLGARDWAAPGRVVDVSVTSPPDKTRLVVLLSDPAAALTVSFDGAPVAASAGDDDGAVRALDLPRSPRVASTRVHLGLTASSGDIEALWLLAAKPRS
jgi:Sulfatase